MEEPQVIDKKQVVTVVAGMFGNILEWYDFALYGFLAIILSKLFFAPGDTIVALLGTYGIFAAGFLMRPLGAWLFGYIGDRSSRSRALLLSVALMGAATFSLGMLPTYTVIGIWAPVLLVALRLLQGLSVGGEFSTSVTYLVERAPQRFRGLFGSFANIGSMVGMLLGVGAATLVTTFLSHDVLLSWGWRVPFLFGGVLGLIALFLRERLPTTILHKKEGHHSAKTPLAEALTNNRREMVQALLFSLGYAVFFYLVLVYLPTYANEFLHISLNQALQVNTAAIALVVVCIPLFGLFSDTLVRRKRLIIGAFTVAAFSLIPFFIFLTTDGLLQFTIMQFSLAVLVSVALGAAPALYVELFPRRDRLTAYSITFNVSLGMFGGTAPFVATWMIHTTGNLLMPAYYAVATLIIALGALLTIEDRSRQVLH